MTEFQFMCPNCSCVTELKNAQYIGLGDNTVLDYFYDNGCHQPFCREDCALHYYRLYYRSFHDPAVVQQGTSDSSVEQLDDLRPLPRWD